jgi:hypothetical protein
LIFKPAGEDAGGLKCVGGGVVAYAFKGGFDSVLVRQEPGAREELKVTRRT